MGRIKLGELIGWSVYSFLGFITFLYLVYPFANSTHTLQWEGLGIWLIGGFVCFIFTGLCIYED